MKFKVEKGHPLFDTLMVVWEKIKVSKDACNALAAEVGSDGVSGSDSYLAGSINAFHFADHKKPNEHWKAMEKGFTPWFMPKWSTRDKATKEIIAKIQSLPKVDTAEINDPLNFKHGAFSTSKGIHWVQRPGVWWFPEYILVSTPEGYKYEPVEGMIELKESEFEALKEAPGVEA